MKAAVRIRHDRETDKMTKRLKRIGLLLCAVLFLTVLGGCGSVVKDNGKPTIVCTVFPEYDWLLNVLGEEAEHYNLKLLLGGSADLHSYQPTAADIAAVASCDLLIYVGGESDAWIEEALKGSINKDMQVIKLSDCLGDRLLEEEAVEGMQEKPFGHSHSGEQEHDHDSEEETEEHHHIHEGEYDEHVWLSLRNAEIFVRRIADAMKQLTPESAEIFERNAAEYTERLAELDSRYTEAVSGSGGKPLLFADRFPFRYLTEDYGLEYYAAFSGCSADAEASFETVVFLADKLSAEKLPAVLILESSDKRLAETIIGNSDNAETEILVMDSMQSVSKEQREAGYSYLSVMENNLETLKKALG